MSCPEGCLVPTEPPYGSYTDRYTNKDVLMEKMNESNVNKYVISDKLSKINIREPAAYILRTIVAFLSCTKYYDTPHFIWRWVISLSITIDKISTYSFRRKKETMQRYKDRPGLHCRLPLAVLQPAVFQVPVVVRAIHVTCIISVYLFYEKMKSILLISCYLVSSKRRFVVDVRVVRTGCAVCCILCIDQYVIYGQ